MYAKRVIQGMLHNLLGLSSSLQTHPSIFLSNLGHTIWEMQRNQYPTSWWLPKVCTTYRCPSQSFLPPWKEFYATLPWIPAIPPKFCTFRSINLTKALSLQSTEAVWGASPIPAAQPVALFARPDQEFSCGCYGILISVGVL